MGVEGKLGFKNFGQEKDLVYRELHSSPYSTLQ